MHGSILALVAAVAPLPPGVVAQIDGSAPVTKAKFEHWLHVAAVSSGDKKAPRPGAKHYSALRDQTLEFLISARWIQGEARERHISFSRAKVIAEYRSTKRQSFKSEREFKTFLRKSGMTIDDVLFRVRIDMSSNAVRRSVVAGKSGDARQKALDGFVAAFRDKWRARTSCAAGYVTDDCGG